VSCVSSSKLDLSFQRQRILHLLGAALPAPQSHSPQCAKKVNYLLLQPLLQQRQQHLLLHLLLHLLHLLHLLGCPLDLPASSMTSCAPNQLHERKEGGGV
jgi:hypothetical protein